MSEISNKIALGTAIIALCAGAGLAIGGAFGHRFCILVAGEIVSAISAVALITIAIKIWLDRNKQTKDKHESTTSVSKIPGGGRIAVRVGGNPYIPNPDQYDVIVAEEILNGHAQYNLKPETGEDL